MIRHHYLSGTGMRTSSIFIGRQRILRRLTASGDWLDGWLDGWLAGPIAH